METKTQKTILEWLQTLPTDHPKYGAIRHKAVAKYDKDWCRAQGASTLQQALTFAFQWKKEGQYWGEIYDALEAGTLFDYQKEQSKSPWISVKDKTPDELKIIYASQSGRKAGEQKEVIFFEEDWHSAFTKKRLKWTPTHWMEKSFIPEPPKE